ncbi:MAG: sporulation initiation factor Spo0A C-terminal domain-containing protein [Clostridia bacterium]|nr:sporulation initiation factor Spo0A C-terminal domain-containing protein [Clostridia bacterium]MDY5555875.1 sporulation initiation factor Spo0A C-terminal domain-containing protein [Blautia sp.]
MSEIYGLIRKLGATSKYKGYYYVADAVKLSMNMQERPLKITKDIYPILARKYKSTPSNIEHNIRTLVNLCWVNHKDVLEEIAGCTMDYKPTNSEFIDILAYYMYKTEDKVAQ